MNGLSCKEEHAFFCKALAQAYETLSETQDTNLTDTSEAGWIWACVAFYTPVCILGVLGNIITIIMFSKFIPKTTTTIFILALAFVDLLVSSTLLPMTIYQLLNGITRSNVSCKMESYIAFLSIPLSGGFLLAIAVDRFILIYILNNNIVTKFRAKIIVAIIAIVCMGAAIPQSLAWSTKLRIDFKGLNSTCDTEVLCDINRCHPDTHFVSSQVRTHLWQAVIIAFLVMVVLFAILYTLIFTKVYKMYKRMLTYKSSGNPSSSNNLENRANNNVSETECRSSSHSNGKRVRKMKNPQEEISRLQFTSRDSSESEEGMIEETALMNLSVPVENLSSNQNSSAPKVKRKRLPHFQTAVTLFVVTLSFVLAYAPMIFMSLLGSCQIIDDYDRSFVACKKNSYKNFVWYFYFLNHVTNPLVYSFLNPRFRSAMRDCYHKYACKLFQKCQGKTCHEAGTASQDRTTCTTAQP